MTALLSLLILLFSFACVGIQIYGIVVCFRNKWYTGLAGLVFPAFSFVIGAAKLCGKDLLA